MTSILTLSDENVSHTVTLHIYNNRLIVLSIVVSCDAKVMKTDRAVVVDLWSLTPKREQTRCTKD